MDSSNNSNNNNELPIGWNDRTNQMSEHDMKLGGIAATKFSTTKGGVTMTNAYSDSSDGIYQTSDQVRDFYYARQQQLETMENNNNNNNDNNDSNSERNDCSNSHSQQLQQGSSSSTSNSILPLGWEERQKSKQLEQLQHGIFSSRNAATSHSTTAASTYPRTTTTSCRKSSSSATSSTTAAAIGATTTRTSTTTTSSSNHTHSSAELALVKIATHTLETLAETLNRNPTSIPMKEREEFATAMRHAMEVMAKCR